MEYSAFENCINLTQVEIPSSVGLIEGGAFFGCTNIKKIICMIQNPSNQNVEPTRYLDENLDYENCKLYVPCNKIEEYTNAQGWNKFTQITCELVSAEEQSAEAEFKDKIYVQDKNIMVDGLSSEEYSIYNTAGKQVGNPVPASGVYVVKVGDEAVKVMVK